MFVVKLVDRETGGVEYRVGEPGQGGVTHKSSNAAQFNTRAEAEAYIGRLVTWSGFEWNRMRVEVEELPEPVALRLEVSAETAQWIRNLIGYVDGSDPHGAELRRVLTKAGFNYQPNQFTDNGATICAITNRRKSCR